MLRDQIAAAIAAVVGAPLQLAQPMTIIATPPSEQANYPAAALWLEDFARVDTQADVVMQDGQGALVGGAYTAEHATPAVLADGVLLAHLGTLRSSGRLWIGARHAPKREELENQLTDLFYQDDLARGRLLVRVDKPRVAGYQLPWSWYVAVFVEDAKWSAEYAFGERLWDWVDITVDVDILVPQSAPLVTTMQLLLSQELGVSVAQPSDLANLTDLQVLDVAALLAAQGA